MKKILIPLFCILFGLSMQANAQSAADVAKQKVEGPQFKFDGGDTHDFGVVKRGPTAFHKFEFTNVGNAPIIVTDVTPSCGCTNVDWSRNPVLPGQKGFIQLSLKTEEQHGVFNKEVYIRSNAYVPNGEKRYTLYIKGNAVGEDAKK
ncbi:MAG: hypothetical protein JWQ38_297 [Flavipsychrobacter sp.]|nr:hypothetical protein [Flavipsychrobacter sp.]